MNNEREAQEDLGEGSIPGRGNSKLKGSEAGTSLEGIKVWTVIQQMYSCPPRTAVSIYYPAPWCWVWPWLCFGQWSVSGCDMSKGLKCACAIGLASWASALPWEAHALSSSCPFLLGSRMIIQGNLELKLLWRAKSNCIFSLKQNRPGELRLDQLIQPICSPIKVKNKCLSFCFWVWG